MQCLAFINTLILLMWFIDFAILFPTLGKGTKDRLLLLLENREFQNIRGKNKITVKWIQGKQLLVRVIGVFEKSRVWEIRIPLYCKSHHHQNKNKIKDMVPAVLLDFEGLCGDDCASVEESPPAFFLCKTELVSRQLLYWQKLNFLSKKKIFIESGIGGKSSWNKNYCPDKFTKFTNEFPPLPTTEGGPEFKKKRGGGGGTQPN